MILYLEGIEKVVLGASIAPLHPMINVQNFSEGERTNVLLATQIYYSGLDMKWIWHNCGHSENKSCSMEVI